MMIQAKKHEKLREKERETELLSVPKPNNIEVYTAWYSKERPRKIIIQNLVKNNDIETSRWWNGIGERSINYAWVIVVEHENIQGTILCLLDRGPNRNAV